MGPNQESLSRTSNASDRRVPVAAMGERSGALAAGAAISCGSDLLSRVVLFRVSSDSSDKNACIIAQTRGSRNNYDLGIKARIDIGKSDVCLCLQSLQYCAREFFRICTCIRLFNAYGSLFFP